MLENIESFCEDFNYIESDGYWVGAASTGPNPFDYVEVYIAGDANGLNPTLGKAAIRVLNNFSSIGSAVKAYLLDIKSTTFKKFANEEVVIQVNDCPNTESLWEFQWLNFCDVDKLDQYEVVCQVNPRLAAGYEYCLWIVTLRNDTPISHHGEFW